VECILKVIFFLYCSKVCALIFKKIPSYFPTDTLYAQPICYAYKMPHASDHVENTINFKTFTIYIGRHIVFIHRSLVNFLVNVFIFKEPKASPDSG